MSLRRLPTNKSPKHKQIIEAVNDYFGSGCLPAQRKLKKDICLWLMARRRGVKLNDEQKDAVWIVRQNIAAKAY